jgi:hypothetical protein
MPGFLGGVHITNVLGLVMLLGIWLVLCELMHILVLVWRHEPLVGWAIGPFGLTLMSLREPSLLSIWLDVIGPACISIGMLILGLFSPLSPIKLAAEPLEKIVVVICGVLIANSVDFANALRDVRYPLWGEARVLRTMQLLRSNCLKIHFTPFGQSYVLTRFGSPPSELLQLLTL